MRFITLEGALAAAAVGQRFIKAAEALDGLTAQPCSLPRKKNNPQPVNGDTVQPANWGHCQHHTLSSFIVLSFGQYKE